MSAPSKAGTRNRTASAAAAAASSSSSSAAASASGDSGDTGTPLFINTLLELVEDPKTQELCSWADDGNTFIVHDPDGFSSSVLAGIFKSGNFASFVRQLNFYGFRKAAKGHRERTHWEFQHSFFVRGRHDLISQIRRKTAQDYSSRDELQVVKDEVEGLRDMVTSLRLAVAGLGRAYTLARTALEDAGMEVPPPAAQVAGVTPDIAALIAKEEQRLESDAQRRARAAAAGSGRKFASAGSAGVKAGAMPVKKRQRAQEKGEEAGEVLLEPAAAAAAASSSSSSSSSSVRPPTVPLATAPSFLPPRGLRIQTGSPAHFVEASSAAAAQAQVDDFPFSPLAAAAADGASSSSSSSSSSLVSPSLAGRASAGAAAAASLDPAVVRRVASLLAGQGQGQRDGGSSAAAAAAAASFSPQRQGSSRGGPPGRGPKEPASLLLLPPKLFDDSVFFGDDSGDDALGLSELRTLTTSMSFEDSSSSASSSSARLAASLASPRAAPRGIPLLGRVSSLESEAGVFAHPGPSAASSVPFGRSFSLGGLRGAAPFGAGLIQAPPLPAAPSAAAAAAAAADHAPQSLFGAGGMVGFGGEQEDDEGLARSAPSFARMSSFGSTASSGGMAAEEAEASSGGSEDEDDDEDDGEGEEEDVVGAHAGRSGSAELQDAFVRLAPARQRELLGRLLPPVLARAAGWDPRLDFSALCALVLRRSAAEEVAGGEGEDEEGARALARLTSTPTDVLLSSLLPLPSVQAVLVQAGLLAAAQQAQNGRSAPAAAAAASSSAPSSAFASATDAAVGPGGYGYLAGEPMPARAMLLAGAEDAARGTGAGGAPRGAGDGIA